MRWMNNQASRPQVELTASSGCAHPVRILGGATLVASQRKAGPIPEPPPGSATMATVKRGFPPLNVSRVSDFPYGHHSQQRR